MVTQQSPRKRTTRPKKLKGVKISKERKPSSPRNSSILAQSSLTKQKRTLPPRSAPKQIVGTDSKKGKSRKLMRSSPLSKRETSRRRITRGLTPLIRPKALSRNRSSSRKSLGLTRFSQSNKYNIAGLCSCLYDSRHKSDRKELEEVLNQFKLSEDEFNALISKKHSPKKFIKKIKSKDTKRQILWDLLVYYKINENYSAKRREGLRKLANWLNVSWTSVAKTEKVWVRTQPRLKTQKTQPQDSTRHQWWKRAMAVLVGGAAMAATGGLAAPALGGVIGTYFMGLSGAAATSAGLASLGGGALASGGWGMVGGKATLMATSGLIGAPVAGHKYSKRRGPIRKFSYQHLGGNGLHVCIGVAGWLTEKESLGKIWGTLPKQEKFSDCYALKWESQHLERLGNTLSKISGNLMVTKMLSVIARAASKKAASKIVWPLTVLGVLSLIDNPWSVAKIRAEEAGRRLAQDLMNNVQGNRPVSLVGFSLGARLIFHALEELARNDRMSLVDHAVLMGGAVSANPKRWRKVRSVVSGRLINAYSPLDGILRYLYRTVELETPAGLTPIAVARVENRNVKGSVPGHLDYMKSLGRLLDFLDIDGIRT